MRRWIDVEPNTPPAIKRKVCRCMFFSTSKGFRIDSKCV